MGRKLKELRICIIFPKNSSNLFRGIFYFLPLPSSIINIAIFEIINQKKSCFLPLAESLFAFFFYTFQKMLYGGPSPFRRTFIFNHLTIQVLMWTVLYLPFPQANCNNDHNNHIFYPVHRQKPV